MEIGRTIFMNPHLGVYAKEMDCFDREEVFSFLQRTKPVDQKECDSEEYCCLEATYEDLQRSVIFLIVFRNKYGKVFGCSMFRNMAKDAVIIANFWNFSEFKSKKLNKIIKYLISNLLYVAEELGFEYQIIQAKCKDEINILINDFKFLDSGVPVQKEGFKFFCKENVVLALDKHRN